MFCGGGTDAPALARSLDALRGDDDGAAVALLFREKKYELAPDAAALAAAEEESGDLRVFFGAAGPGAARDVSDFARERGSRLILFLRAGDEPDRLLPRRLRLFFDENAEDCALAYTPRAISGGGWMPGIPRELPAGSVFSAGDGHEPPDGLFGAAVWAEDMCAECAAAFGEESPAGPGAAMGDAEAVFLRLLRGVYARKPRFGLLAEARITAPPPWPVSVVLDARGYLVSCIVPVYNVGRYLAEALDSVIAQTVGFEKNVQLLLVNDGSTDCGGDICREYLGR
jgi:hypothetical protein